MQVNSKVRGEQAKKYVIHAFRETYCRVRVRSYSRIETIYSRTKKGQPWSGTGSLVLED